ncbi:unnamed protein product, partial [Allacma fusca]
GIPSSKIIYDVHTLGILSIKDVDETVLEYELWNNSITVRPPLTEDPES